MSVNTISPAPRRQHAAHLPLPALLLFVAGVTLSAAALAWLLSAVVGLPDTVVVLTVMTVAFSISWIVTNHRPAPSHRVTTIPARVRTL